MRLGEIIDYYSREDIQDAMLAAAKDREVAGVFRNGSFGPRPNSILYKSDIMSMIRQGMIEFHCSLERWKQPMAIRQGNYGTLRKGWDLVLDLDCKEFLHGRAAAVVFCRALEKHDIRNYSVKFTGGSGFHIGIPWESMPKEINFIETRTQYPDLARTIALYLKEYAREDMKKALLRQFGTPEKIAEQIKAPASDLMKGTGKSRAFDPYAVVEVDPVLISPRHLFRMPYSLNKKSFFVSLPLKPSQVRDFEKKQAVAARIKPDTGFLCRGEPGEAELLFGEAVDWESKRKRPRKSTSRIHKGPDKAVDKELFPPCIKSMLEGDLRDGRKRSIFVLVNFLSSMGWKHDKIEETLLEWNQKNVPPLREGYITGQVRYHEGRMRSGQEKKPPPSCSREGYYESIGVCAPDTICGGSSKNIKNPVNYPFRKMEKEKPKRKSLKTKPKTKRRGDACSHMMS